MNAFDEEPRNMRSNSTDFFIAAHGNWRQKLHRHSDNAKTFFYLHQQRILLIGLVITFLIALMGLLRTPSCACPVGPSSPELEALPSTHDRLTMSSTDVSPSTTQRPRHWLECEDATWALFGRKCFKLGANNTFASGLHSCQILGGTVASVHSMDQNIFLAKLANDTLGKREAFFIGLQRTSGVWKWVDSSVADFVHWAKGEPNGHQYGEHCTEVWGRDVDHAWNDVPCSARLPIVCQMNAYGVGVLEPG